jgi:hypothetical protein
MKIKEDDVGINQSLQILGRFSAGTFFFTKIIDTIGYKSRWGLEL